MRIKNLKITVLLTAFFLSGCFLYGCHTSNQSVNQNENGASIEPVVATDAEPLVTKRVEAPVHSGEEHVQNAMFHNIKGIEGQFNKIAYAGDLKFLIAADKLYLYDVVNQKVIAEQELLIDEVEQIRKTDAGYVVLGHSDNLVYYCSFYNKSLEAKENYNVNELLELNDEGFLQNADISPDGMDLIAVNFGQQLYIYHFNEKKNQMLLDIAKEDSEQIQGLCDIEQVCFTDQGRKIAFFGQKFEENSKDGSNGVKVIGSVSVDGSELDVKETGTFVPQYMYSFNDYVLYGEDITAAMINGEASGETWKYKTNNHKISKFVLRDKNESEAIYSSDGGKYFASVICGEEEWKVRIYDSETGSQTGELEVSNENDKVSKETRPLFYFYEDSGVYLFYSKDYTESGKDKIQIGQIPQMSN